MISVLCREWCVVLRDRPSPCNKIRIRMHNIITLYIAISIHKVCHTVQRRAKNIKKTTRLFDTCQEQLKSNKNGIKWGKTLLQIYPLCRSSHRRREYTGRHVNPAQRRHTGRTIAVQMYVQDQLSAHSYLVGG